MTDDILLDRVFKRFDADNDGYVNREEWILGLSVFLKGTDTERVQGERVGREIASFGGRVGQLAFCYPEGGPSG